MGVESWDIAASTPALPFPLQGGGDAAMPNKLSGVSLTVVRAEPLEAQESIRISTGSTRTLVLLPSLGLLAQTLREWTFAAAAPFEVLCVCSDQTVGSRGDDEAIHSGGRRKLKPHLLKFPFATKIPFDLKRSATFDTGSLLDNARPPFNEVMSLLPEFVICPRFI